MFTARLSPRRHIRVDRAGTHRYEGARLPASAPDHPWAVYLADAAGRYRLVVWDLDVSAGPDVVAEDLGRLSELLDDAGIGYVTVRSGPAGGRHVWAAFPDGAPGDLVRRMARGLRTLLPSLDPRPLVNPAVGCARPPGSPHRHGGRSVLESPADPHRAFEVLQAGNPVDRLELLVAGLPPAARDAAATAAPPSGEAARRVVADADGPRLAGQRRALSEGSDELLYRPGPGGDASAVAWRVLLRCAHARWSRADVAALLADPATAGLEHLRSRPGPRGGRVPRDPAGQQQLLARQWARAVAYAAEQTVESPAGAVDGRGAHVAAVVAAVEAAADAVPSRWATQAGPADRAVLRAVCLMALTARRLDIALDCRRAAVLAGYGRTAAAVALRRLATDSPVDGPAWLVQVTPATGRTAAVWRPRPPAEPHDLPPVDTERTQGRQPAPPRGWGLGSLVEAVSKSENVLGKWDGVMGGTDLVGHLSRHLAISSHDLFSHGRLGGLGHPVGRTYAVVVCDGARSVDQVAAATGYTTATVRAHLSRLTAFRLVRTTRAGRIRPGPGTLDAAARRLDVAGTAGARERAYLHERETYRWWCDELEWRRRPGKPRHRGLRHRVVPAPGQAAIPMPRTGRAVHGGFPTRPDGRADYTTARHLVTWRHELDPTTLTVPADPVAAAVALLTNAFDAVVMGP